MELHFDEPDLFTTGAIGPKGQRIFFLQARQGADTAAVKVEKQQVATLANYLEQLLEMLPDADEELLDLPHEPLDPSQEPEADPGALLWAAGGLEIGYSANQDKIALFIEELNVDEDGDMADGGAATGRLEDSGSAASDLEDTEFAEQQDRIRIFLRRDQTMAFIRQARELIAAGRPLCPICTEPLNFDDGFCPCRN